MNKHLGKVFVASGTYLVAIILLGFFILPGVFNVESYDFLLGVELFLKVTSVVAVIALCVSAVAIPSTKLLARKPVRKLSPTLTAAVTLLAGLGVILVAALYVKFKTCPPELVGEAWHCMVPGESAVGSAVVVLFLSLLVGAVTWIVQKVICLHKN